MIICRTCDPKSKHSGSSLYRDELNPAEIRTRSSESHEFPTLGLAARVHAALIVASTTRRNAATKPAPGTKPALELPAHGGRARAGRRCRQAGGQEDRWKQLGSGGASDCSGLASLRVRWPAARLAPPAGRPASPLAAAPARRPENCISRTSQSAQNLQLGQFVVSMENLTPWANQLFTELVQVARRAN